MEQLPYSQACENNKHYIREVLGRVFGDRKLVLEIGSGTGQHAEYFAGALPGVRWQPTELAVNLPVLLPRCRAYAGGNLLAPQPLDVCDRPWKLGATPDAVFTANTLHIMPWDSVVELFGELGQSNWRGALLAIYGPFNYGGRYTSDSNAQFDQWLAARHPLSAIRHFERVEELAVDAGYSLLEDNAMPANNRLLVFRCD